MSPNNPASSYYALALQTACRSVDSLSVADARAQIGHATDRIAQQIAGSKRFLGQDLRLVVLPEYVLTSFPWDSSPSEWRAKAAIAPDGREIDALKEIAAANAVYLCANVYETDAHFPELYFQSNLILAPNGDVVLRYRRLISMFAPSPHDVLDAYLDVYGQDALFPVARTEIGVLGAIASEEILYPEIARAFALKGAEILLHPTSEVGSPQATPKDICKPARAIENLAYVVSANTAQVLDAAVPAAATDAMSKIVDYKGRTLAEAGSGDSLVAWAEIDLAALRRFRRRPGMANLLSRQPLDLYARVYQDGVGAPANGLKEGRAPLDRAYFAGRQADMIQRLIETGVLSDD